MITTRGLASRSENEAHGAQMMSSYRFPVLHNFPIILLCGGAAALFPKLLAYRPVLVTAAVEAEPPAKVQLSRPSCRVEEDKCNKTVDDFYAPLFFYFPSLSPCRLRYRSFVCSVKVMYKCACHSALVGVWEGARRVGNLFYTLITFYVF